MGSVTSRKARSLVVGTLAVGLLSIGVWSITAGAQERSGKPDSPRDSATDRPVVAQPTVEFAVLNAELQAAVVSAPAALANLTNDAVANVSFCAQHYLYDSRPLAVQNYRMCVAAATGLVTAQVAKGLQVTSVEVTDALHLLAVWAAVQERVAAAAGVDVVATDEQMSAFVNCITDYDGNVAFCNGHYQPNSTGLTNCLNGAQTALNSCLNKLYA